jgi:hypothetical protein
MRKPGQSETTSRIDREERNEKAGQPGRYYQEKTAGKGPLEQESQDRTPRGGLPGKDSWYVLQDNQGKTDCQDRTIGQDSQDGTARKEQPKQNTKDKTARTGQPGWDWGQPRQDSQDRTARTGEPKKDSQ